MKNCKFRTAGALAPFVRLDKNTRSEEDDGAKNRVASGATRSADKDGDGAIPGLNEQKVPLILFLSDGLERESCGTATKTSAQQSPQERPNDRPLKRP